ncbi:hypothetical protein FEZ18_02820 [Oceanihabitans sp. IOP_32]|nr:hypothetical protein FEZ18_02820 [Oceanihabitans sp. IOP_32]
MLKRKLALIMSKKKKIICTCKEANHICDKVQYKEASLFEKLKLYLHLWFCGACKKFTKNNIKLTKKLKESKLECLDESCKAAMKTTLKKAINEHSD